MVNNHKELKQAMLDFLENKLNSKDICILFQNLSDTGIIHNLNGHYQRIAAYLLADKHITRKREK